jgi:CheY-like chemotaxis protein
MKTIMIVDDEKDTRDSLELIVEREGYDSICAYNGAEAIKKLREAETLPDLILLDIMMPGVTAKEVVAEISKTERYSKIKIIYVTAVNVTDAEEKELLKPEQAVGFIIKPFELKVIVKEIRKVIG